jgi:putative transposase
VLTLCSERGIRIDRTVTEIGSGLNGRRTKLRKLLGDLRDHDVVVIEDLAVANMIRNRRLARRIADASWAEIRRQITDKTQRTGGELIVADRWFASSKTCSGCGAAKAKPALSERTYVCMECGTVLDRDVNDAINLAALAADRAQLVREQPEGTGVRRPPVDAVGPPREESARTQPHRREMVSR